MEYSRDQQTNCTSPITNYREFKIDRELDTFFRTNPEDYYNYQQKNYGEKSIIIIRLSIRRRNYLIFVIYFPKTAPKEKINNFF